MAPQETPLLEARNIGGNPMIERRIPPTGDPFMAGVPAKKLAKLEEKLRHEILSVEERCELEDMVLRLRRRMTREESQ
jgi:hypothetical protein